MVWISLQDDVKRSFEKVKDDILNLKRAVNGELLAVEEIGSSLQTFVGKDEFYSFVKRLGERLDRIDESIEVYLGYGDEIKSVEGRVKSLGRKLSRQEDLEREVKEVRALGGRLAALEGSTVSAQKFNESLGRVYSDVSSVKASMLTAKAIDGLKAKLASAEKRVEELERSVPSKEGVSGALAAVEGLRKRVENFEEAVREKAEDAEKENARVIEDVSGRLTADIESLRASCIDRSSFEKSLKELRKESASIRGILESSVSEVDFSDYVTKKELGKRLLALEELNSDISKVAQDNAEMENSLESLKREYASVEDVRRIGADVKEISRSLDSLKAVIEKAIDSSQKRASQELEQTRAKFEKEISRLNDDFEGKLEKIEKEKASVRRGEGAIARLGRGFADFFREGEGEREVKVKAKPAPSVSELLKEEEKKKSRRGPGLGRFVVPAIITAVVVALFLLVFWLANRASDGAEEAAENNASGFVEEVPKADGAALVNEPAEETADAGGEQGVSAAPGTIEYCRQEYECKERGDGSYWFSCYLDEAGTCRCFVTDAKGCGVSEEKAEKAAEVIEVRGGKGRAGYMAAAVIVFAMFLVVYFSVLRNNKAEGKKQKKVKEKAREDDGEGVDLEEFFQKK